MLPKHLTNPTARVANQLLMMILDVHRLAVRRGFGKHTTVKNLIHNYNYVLHGRQCTNPRADKYRAGAIKDLRRCLTIIAPRVGENVTRRLTESIDVIDSSLRLLRA